MSPCRQDKLQINTAPGDKAGGRQPQAAQVASAPPVVHKEPVSLGTSIVEPDGWNPLQWMKFKKTIFLVVPVGDVFRVTLC